MRLRASAHTLLAGLLVACTALSGCTSLRQVQLDKNRLHEEILSGNVVAIGDRIRITTSSGKQLTFRVTDIRDETLIGKKVTVAVRDIEKLESRNFSYAKTGALTSGVGLIVGVILVVSSLAFFPG